MRKTFFLPLLFVILNLFQPLSAQEFPAKSNPPRLVNDFAGILSSQEEALLEQKLLSYNDSTSTQVAIVTVKSLNDYAASDYATQLAEQWGVGQKGKDNGVLILVAPQEREAFITTGYGMEGTNTDAMLKRIYETEMKPNFKAGNYYKGLDMATTSIFLLAAGEYKGEAKKQSKPSGKSFLPFIILIIILFMFMRKRRGNHISSRGVGIWSLLALLNSGRGSGSYSDFSSGGGIFGGGGGGGGGFGGFGGGSFGGGGAGGSW